MSCPFFFSSGRTTACLKSDGKIPDASNLLKSSAMKGDNSWPMSFASQVGTGSNWHVLFSAKPIIFSTSSSVTAVHWESVGITLSGTSYSGVVTVEAQTESTLSLKYMANSSAILLPVSSVTASPSTLCSVRHTSVSYHCLQRSWCSAPETAMLGFIKFTNGLQLVHPNSLVRISTFALKASLGCSGFTMSVAALSVEPLACDTPWPQDSACQAAASSRHDTVQQGHPPTCHWAAECLNTAVKQPGHMQTHLTRIFSRLDNWLVVARRSVFAHKS